MHARGGQLIVFAGGVGGTLPRGPAFVGAGHARLAANHHGQTWTKGGPLDNSFVRACGVMVGDLATAWVPAARIQMQFESQCPRGFGIVCGHL